MAEIVLGPFKFSDAEKLVAKLMDASGAFRGGANPLVGRLKKSYGYGKIIGVRSFDNKVSVRIDFEPDTKNDDGTVVKGKGYHFNFSNDNTGEKICVLICDIGEKTYQGYIDRLTAGRSLIVNKKGPILKINKNIHTKDHYDPKLDSYFDYVDSNTGKTIRIVIKGLSKTEGKDIINMLATSQIISSSDSDVSDDNIDEMLVLDRFYFLYAIEVLELTQERNLNTKENNLFKEHNSEILYDIFNYILLPMSDEMNDYDITHDYDGYPKKWPRH